jgi:hypothetical protein
LVLIAIVVSFVARGLVVPRIAEARSYRPFMIEVNRLVSREDKLYLYRYSFNSDQVVFYRGAPLSEFDALGPPASKVAAKIGHGDAYVIMAEREWLAIQKLNSNLPPPLLQSAGKGPEGDARIVLVRAEAW